MAYLVHHGILGQKWGVRRYQNDDGSLTSAGESRYYSEAGKRRFNFGEHATEVARVTHKVSSHAGRVLDAAKPLKDKVDGFKGSGKTRSSKNSERSSKREPMSSEKKKALAKKILIGVGATALTAAAVYGASKGMESYANKLLLQAKDKAVTSFADQSMKAHTTVSKKFLRRPKSKTDLDSVFREVTSYQKQAEKSVKEAVGKKKNIADSYQIIKAYRRKPIKVNYRKALDSLKFG